MQRQRDHGTHAQRLHSAHRASHRGQEGSGLQCGSSPSHSGHPVLHMHPSDQEGGLCRYNSDTNSTSPLPCFVHGEELRGSLTDHCPSPSQTPFKGGQQSWSPSRTSGRRWVSEQQDSGLKGLPSEEAGIPCLVQPGLVGTNSDPENQHLHPNTAGRRPRLHPSESRPPLPLPGWLLSLLPYKHTPSLPVTTESRPF